MIIGDCDTSECGQAPERWAKAFCQFRQKYFGKSDDPYAEEVMTYEWFNAALKQSPSYNGAGIILKI